MFNWVINMEKLKKELLYTMIVILGLCLGIFIEMIFKGYNINKVGAPWMGAIVSSFATIAALVISMGNDEKDRKAEVEKGKKEVEKYRELVLQKKNEIASFEFAVLNIINLIQRNNFDDKEVASIISKNKDKLLDISKALYLRDPDNVLNLNNLIYDAEKEQALDVYRVVDEINKTLTNLQLEFKKWEKFSV